jgi:hypothetical protein
LAEPMLTERFIMKNVSTLRPQALKAGFQFQWSFSLPMTMVVASSIQCWMEARTSWRGCFWEGWFSGYVGQCEFNFFLPSFVLAVLTLCLLAGAPPLEPCPSTFCFRYFLNSVSHLFLGWPGLRSSYLAGMTSVWLVEMRSCKFFAWADLEPQFSWSQPPE